MVLYPYIPPLYGLKRRVDREIVEGLKDWLLIREKEHAICC